MISEFEGYRIGFRIGKSKKEVVKDESNIQIEICLLGCVRIMSKDVDNQNPSDFLNE